MDTLEMVYSSQALRIATARNLILQAWRDRPTVANIREFGRTVREVAQSYPKGSAVMNLVLAGSAAQSVEARQESAKLEADEQLFPLGAVRVVLIPGLSGLRLRTWLQGAALFGQRSARPSLVCGDLSRAAQWLTAQLAAGDEPWTAEQIEALATALRTRPGGG